MRSQSWTWLSNFHFQRPESLISRCSQIEYLVKTCFLVHRQLPHGRRDKGTLWGLFIFGHTACGISVPWPGIEPRQWQWKCCALTTRPPGNSPGASFYKGTNPIPRMKVKTSWLNNSPVAPPSNRLNMEIQFQHMNLIDGGSGAGFGYWGSI